MRKRPLKLALRKQTLRALSDVSLGRIVGGQDDDAVRVMGVTDDHICVVAALKISAAG